MTRTQDLDRGGLDPTHQSERPQEKVGVSLKNTSLNF